MRSQEFEESASTAREPDPIQVRPFAPTSVLDNLRPNPNGMGGRDLERRLVGVQRSSIGTADDTYDKRLWLPATREPSQRFGDA